MILFLDTETYQDNPALDLPNVGVHRYVEGVQVDLFAYAIDNGPVKVWDVRSGEKMPADLNDAFGNADLFVAHNMPFDRPVIKSALGIDLPIEKCHCTSAQALSHGLPGSLAQVGQALGLSEDQAKMKVGSRLVMRFCKPAPATHKAHRYGPDNDPENWALYKDYAIRDVEALREIYNKLPRLNYPDNEFERNLWELDQTINNRGLPIDKAGVAAALSLIDSEKFKLDGKASALSGGEVPSAGNAVKTKAWLEAQGVAVTDLQKATVTSALKRNNLPDNARQMLRLRQQASMTSTAKYEALSRATGQDGRMRGTLQYCGASRTGRWSGRLFQPQNLMRPTVDSGLAAQAILNGSADIVYDDVMGAAGSAVRSMIKAPGGHFLAVADLANIEGRVLAWLANEEWKIKAFGDYDTIVEYDEKGDPIRLGPDLYILGYSKSFSIPVEQVTKDQRQIGKVQELALGYQGGVGAFQQMAAGYGVVVDDERADELKVAWRLAHPRIKDMWYDVENKAACAIRTPNTIQIAGKLKFKCAKVGALNYMFMQLPSGRVLCYAQPSLVEGSITYMGINQYSRKWERLETYGGKLVENATQALARDVMAYNMPDIEAHGFEIVGSVHDEIITLVNGNKLTGEQLADLMAVVPPWAEGMPLAAEGYTAERYRK